MDRNLLLAMVLSMLVLVLWSSLQPPQPEPDVPPGKGAAPPMRSEPGPPMHPARAAERPPVVRATPAEATIQRYERPLYRAELTNVGAGLRHWELTQFDTGGSEPQPIVLTTGRPPDDTVAGATPFEDPEPGGREHQRTEGIASRLGLGDLSRVAWEVESQDAGGATFVLSRNGVTVRKTWELEEPYTIRMRLEVENESAADVATDFAVDWPARVAEGNDFREQALIALHAGSVKQELLASFGRAGFWNSFTGPPETVIVHPGENDWGGLHTTYFLSVLRPDDPVKASVRFEVVEPGTSGFTRIFFEHVRIPPGLDLAREFTGYLGPKVPELLQEFGGDANRAIDLGWSWVAPLTRFFGWLLHEIYGVVPNYGVAIILLTIMVRVVTTPLTLRQMRSMERMRAVQPRLKEIQQKYADDRQKQSEEMMRLYRQEKVNPLGGCVPMVLQLPVFIGLFYALRSSIQLRQAPFFGWIDDLSAPEVLFVIPGLELPVRILPLVMGASMVLQQRITPMQVDPAQARMMMTVMPIMMTVIFYQFASGLVLYWMVSNVLAIAHQLWVGRRMRSDVVKA